MGQFRPFGEPQRSLRGRLKLSWRGFGPALDPIELAPLHNSMPDLRNSAIIQCGKPARMAQVRHDASVRHHADSDARHTPPRGFAARGFGWTTAAGGGSLFKGEQWRESEMSLDRGVYTVLICAGYAYVAFWTAFFVYAAVAQH
jgi:hypothetical protein